MITNFIVSDFIITGDSVPLSIADKILLYHMNPLQAVRTDLGYAVYPSAHSSFRPFKYELDKGRNGLSEHTFGQDKKGIIDPNKKGATDVTCHNFRENKEVLLNSLIKNTEYVRFAVYSTFIHCDYKDTNNGKRIVFTSNTKSQWKFLKFV